MIRHIVLIRFGPAATDAKIAALWAELHAITGKVAGLRSIVSGRSDSPEQMERGFMHGFVADFDDGAALQRYQDHPDHRALAAGLVAHAAGGIDGILVFDLAVAN